MPKPDGEFYAPVMPRWFNNLLRLIFALFGLGAAYMCLKGWGQTHVLLIIFLSIFSVVFVSLAIHPGGVARFSNTPFLMADRHGMYFKHRMTGATELGPDADNENAIRKKWIFIPWAAISNIRIAPVSKYGLSSDDYMLGAIFDLDGIISGDLDSFIYPEIGKKSANFSAVFYFW